MAKGIGILDQKYTHQREPSGVMASDAPWRPRRKSVRMPRRLRFAIVINIRSCKLEAMTARSGSDPGNPPGAFRSLGRSVRVLRKQDLRPNLGAEGEVRWRA